MILRCNVILNYPGWAHCHHGVFIRGRQEGQRRWQQKQRSESRERFEGTAQPTLKMEEGLLAKECRQMLEAGKGKESFSLGVLRQEYWSELPFLSTWCKDGTCVSYVVWNFHYFTEKCPPSLLYPFPLCCSFSFRFSPSPTGSCLRRLENLNL